MSDCIVPSVKFGGGGIMVKIPITTLLNLVKSLPRRVEAAIAAKGGPTSY